MTPGVTVTPFCVETIPFLQDEPFLHLVGDHLYVNQSGENVARLVLDTAQKNGCSVSVVQQTRETQISNYGTIGAERVQGQEHLFRITRVIEKPVPSYAEQHLLVPGLRIGHYFCFFGMHVCSPVILELLRKRMQEFPDQKLGLSESLNELSRTNKYLALERNDLRFDIGQDYGLLKAQIALSLTGMDRELLMGELLQFFIEREKTPIIEAMGKLVDIITSGESEVRDQSIGGFCRNASPEELELECDQLELFRNQNHNLYEKVRALFFLYYIHRFALPFLPQASRKALIPYKAYKHIMNRRFEEGIEILRSVQKAHGLNQGICSALADAYRKLGFQTLTDQVKMSVRNTVGNSWMFRIGHPLDQPLWLRKELVTPDPLTAIYPILKETTPVRMDLSHSCWSDIFFLGMDFPEGARVLNISVDLCIAGAGETPVPPVEACLRVIDEPVIRLVSTDLEAVSVIRKISDVFNFADDYLGLLKAAVIASGIIPPGMEGLDMPVASFSKEW